MFMQPGTPAQPNPDFLVTVQRHFAPDRKLIVGCQSGVRSMKACQLLSSEGYSDLSNVLGGFGGGRDASGQPTVVGWRDSGLPIETTARVGRTYPELKD
jgi:rhodanese-related sulfurtransferase